MSIEEGIFDEEELEEDDPHIGRTIGGRFEVVARLGDGGMGQVYEAVQYPVGRRVALKVLKSSLAENRRFLARFEREAQAIAHLNHPNIVTLYDFGVDPKGDSYIAMEYVEGRMLTLYLREKVDIGFVLHVISQVLAALQEAHDQGIVHRDLKPDNIMLTTVGADDVFVKVLDFGLAHLASDSEDVAITAAGEVFGTPLYMSPEQATGDEITPATDVYALGCILYELLSGRPPFRGTRPMNVLMKHVNAPVPDLIPKESIVCSPQLIKLTMRCLEKSPEDRYATVEQLLDAIYQLPEGPQLTHSMPSLTHGLTPPKFSTGTGPVDPADASLAETAAGGQFAAEILDAEAQEAGAAAPAPGRGKQMVFVGLVIAIVVAAVVVSLVFKDDPKTVEDDSQTEAPETPEISTDKSVAVAQRAVGQALNKSSRLVKLEFVVFGHFRAALSDPSNARPGKGVKIRKPLGSSPWYEQVDTYHHKNLTSAAYTDPVELMFGD